MAPPPPQGPRTLRSTKKPARSTVVIASESLNQTFRDIPVSWCTCSEDPLPSNSTTGSPEALSDRLERLDSLSPLYNISPPSSLMPVQSENARSRIRIKAPTKPSSRIVLRTQKSTIRGISTPERPGPTKAPRPRLAVDTKLSLMKDGLHTRTVLHTQPNFNHPPVKSTVHVTRNTTRNKIPTIAEDPLYYFLPVLLTPRLQRNRLDVRLDLESRIRSALTGNYRPQVKMDPAIISCGPVSPEKAQFEPIPFLKLPRPALSEKAQSNAIPYVNLPLFKNIQSEVVPIHLDATTGYDAEADTFSEDYSYYDTTSHDLTPTSSPFITISKRPVTVMTNIALSISSDKENHKSVGTQKLNPRAKEFSTLGYQAKRPALNQMVNDTGNELHVPKKRRPQLQALSIPAEPIYIKTDDILKTAYTCAIPPTTPLSPQSGLPLDEDMEPGRVAIAMDPRLAGPLLQKFIEKYPMTGKRKFASPPATAKGRHAAVMQQRIEFLLMQQKEKKALEALQTQMKK